MDGSTALAIARSLHLYTGQKAGPARKPIKKVRLECLYATKLILDRAMRTATEHPILWSDFFERPMRGLFLVQTAQTDWRGRPTPPRQKQAPQRPISSRNAPPRPRPLPPRARRCRWPRLGAWRGRPFTCPFSLHSKCPCHGQALRAGLGLGLVTGPCTLTRPMLWSIFFRVAL